MKKSQVLLNLLSGKPAFPEPLHVGRPMVGHREAFLSRVEKMLDSHRFTNDGPYVKELEQRVAEFLGVRYCVAVCNGTAALRLLVRAMGLGGVVIVPSFTFVATAHALSWEGISPVFCDIDSTTWNLDPAECEGAITPETSAILGVHLFGRPCDTDALERIARPHRIPVIYDAAHAFGCTGAGRKVGTFGAASAFSFHSTKVFHTFEGGAVVTHDEGLALEIRRLRNFGFREFDDVGSLGTNAKMPEVCAAMGLSNLESYPDFVSVNRSIFEVYETCLQQVPGLRLRTDAQEGERNWHYVLLEVDEPELGMSRDQLLKVLHAENVLARRYFYPGVHAMEPYRTRDPDAGIRLPRTVHAAAKVLALPGGGAVTHAQARKICSILATAAHRAEEVRAVLRFEERDRRAVETETDG